MELAVQQLTNIEGVRRLEVEEALLQMAADLKAMDEKIKVRTDHEVWQLFQAQQSFMKNLVGEMKEVLSIK